MSNIVIDVSAFPTVAARTRGAASSLRLPSLRATAYFLSYPGTPHVQSANCFAPNLCRKALCGHVAWRTTVASQHAGVGGAPRATPGAHVLIPEASRLRLDRALSGEHSAEAQHSVEAVWRSSGGRLAAGWRPSGGRHERPTPSAGAGASLTGRRSREGRLGCALAPTAPKIGWGG